MPVLQSQINTDTALYRENSLALQSLVNDLYEKVTEISLGGSLAAHFHDTQGQVLANIEAVLRLGVSTIDSAVGGLGGCPYADGAAGNVATEKVIDKLEKMRIKTDVDSTILQKVIDFIDRKLQG